MTKLKNTNRNGYSLIEMAIVMIVIGVLFASFVTSYKNYVVYQKKEETKSSVNVSLSEIGNFRAVHGRYPCPASMTSAPGDIAYGHENINCRDNDIYPADGVCVGGLCGANSARSGIGKIIIGSIPFKSMNIQESETFDGYGNRLLYAVTVGLTKDTTFALDKGGITVLNADDQQMTEVPDGGHFLVFSAGENGYGAYTRMGSITSPCTGASLPEQENCDQDSVFKILKQNPNFDDFAGYYTSANISYWQVSSFGSSDIFLKGAASNMSIGFTPSDDLSAASERANIKNDAVDSGTVWSRNANIRSNYLCNFGASDLTNLSECFQPSIFGGSTLLSAAVEDQGGMKCPDTDPYLVGIKNSQPVCRDEVFMACPVGTFLASVEPKFDGAGSEIGKVIKCSDIVARSCEAKTVLNSCGQSRDLGFSIHKGLSSVYGGRYYKFVNDYDAAYFRNLVEVDGYTLPQMIAHVNFIINIEAREAVDGVTAPQNPLPNLPSSALIRDTYTCNDGTWNEGAQTAHERQEITNNFPLDKLSTAPLPLAEISGDFEYSVGEDILNSGQHDCWCREDYRASLSPCASGYTGNKLLISKHKCPQTAHIWSPVLAYEGFCSCVAGPASLEQTCASYYGVSADRITGVVYYKQNYVCDAGGRRADGGPYDINTDGCKCPANAATYATTSCPAGYHNAFVLEGRPFTNAATVSKTEWICPTPKTPGHWGPAVALSDVPPCDCGGTRVKVEACASGLDGTGIYYNQPYNCTLGDWEPDRSLWTLDHNDCKTCSWRSSGDAEWDPERHFSKKVGSICACGTSPNNCYDDGPSIGFNNWHGCQCLRND